MASMSDLFKDPVSTLREALAASTARIPAFESAVTIAQERLRRELTKVEKLRELVAIYEADEAPETATQLNLPNTTSANGIPSFRPKLRVREPAPGNPVSDDPGESKKAQMVRFIDGLLSLRGSVHRSEILSGLQEAGIMGHERNPMAHLAAFLSTERDKFASDGKGNFSLRAPLAATDPPPAANGAGSAGMEAGDAGFHP